MTRLSVEMDSIRELLRPATQLPKNMSIIEANLGDQRHADALVHLLDEFAQERLGIGRPLSDEVKKNLVPGLRAHPAAFSLLVFLSKEPVGVAVCFRGFSTFQAQPIVNVHDLYVRRRFRGRSIGRELLRVVEQKAREFGCSRITLEVRDDNESALRLYESAGFDGERSRDGRPRTLFLEKALLRRRV